MEPTKVLPCSCTSDFQDKEYGKGMRVHNHASAKGTKNKRYRCTVCGKERE